MSSPSGQKLMHFVLKTEEIPADKKDKGNVKQKKTGIHI
jgi:hypothetical protein